MNYRSRVRQILTSLGTRPRKTLSQNFMVDERALDAMVEAVSRIEADTILEVGPGLGFLTERLAKLGRPLICVEKDKRFCQYLEKHFQEARDIKIVQEDILVFPFERHLKNRRTVCIGNIPYQISSPLLEALLSYRGLWAAVLLTTQKDFAKRLSARPGSRECGSLSCWMQLHCGIKILRDFERTSFFPVPKVESSFVEISFYQEPLYEFKDGPWIRDGIRYAFQKRRKHILNGLALSPLGLDKQTVVRCLEKAGIAASARPEVLTLEQWVMLGKNIREAKKEGT